MLKLNACYLELETFIMNKNINKWRIDKIIKNFILKNKFKNLNLNLKYIFKI